MSYTVISSREPIEKHPDDDRDYFCDISKELPSGVLVSTVAVTPPAGINISGAMATVADYIDDQTGETVRAGTAITWRGSGGTSGETYDVEFICSYDNGETVGVNVPHVVENK